MTQIPQIDTIDRLKEKHEKERRDYDRMSKFQIGFVIATALAVLLAPLLKVLVEAAAYYLLN